MSTLVTAALSCMAATAITADNIIEAAPKYTIYGSGGIRAEEQRGYWYVCRQYDADSDDVLLDIKICSYVDGQQPVKLKITPHDQGDYDTAELLQGSRVVFTFDFPRELG